MNLFDVCRSVFENLSFKTDGLMLILILTLVQITPIKINPWSALVSFIGRFLNRDVVDEINKIKETITLTEEKLNKVADKLDEFSVVEVRARILRFGDEVSHKVDHSKEHFLQVIEDINLYESYCDSHPGFKNNTTKLTSEIIKNDFQERCKINNFL